MTSSPSHVFRNEQSLNSIRNSLSIRKTAAPKQAAGSALRLAVASQDAGAQRLRGQKLESGHEHRHEDGGHAKRRSSGEPLTLRRSKAQHRPAHCCGAADQSSPRKRCAAHVARRRRRRAGAIRTSAHATRHLFKRGRQRDQLTSLRCQPDARGTTRPLCAQRNSRACARLASAP